MGTRSLVMIMIGVATAGTLVFFLLRDRGESSPPPVSAGTKASAGERSGVTHRDDVPRPPDVEVPALASESDLATYLDRVEDDARARGLVTETDFRRGTAAIEAMSDRIGAQRVSIEIRTFGERMSLVQRELELAPIKDELAELAAAISAATNPDDRERLTVRYRTKAAGLPEIDRLDAIEKLKAIP